MAPSQRQDHVLDVLSCIKPTSSSPVGKILYLKMIFTCMQRKQNRFDLGELVDRFVGLNTDDGGALELFISLSAVSH